MIEDTNQKFIEAIQDLRESNPRSEVLRVVNRALPGFELSPNELDILYKFSKDILLSESEFNLNEDIAKHYLRVFPYYQVLKAERKHNIGNYNHFLKAHATRLRQDILENNYLVSEDQSDTYSTAPVEDVSQYFGATNRPNLPNETNDQVLDTATSNIPVDQSEESTQESDFSPTLSTSPSSTYEANPETTILESTSLASQTEIETDPTQTTLTHTSVQTATQSPTLPQEQTSASATNLAGTSFNLTVEDEAQSLQMGVKQNSGQGRSLQYLETVQTAEAKAAVEEDPKLIAQRESIEANRLAYEQAEQERLEQLRIAGIKEEETRRQQAKAADTQRRGNRLKKVLIGTLVGSGAFAGTISGLSIFNIIT